MSDPDLGRAARKAWFFIEQLKNMRANIQHITSLEGIAHFVGMFNDKAREIRELLAHDPLLLETLDFLKPISPDTSGSEYPSDIIVGKRGQFMVDSGLLIKALESFVKMYIDEADRRRLGIPED